MRLIDADALRVWTAHHVDEAGYIANFAVVSEEDIKNAPTIDAEPVKHGHWEESPIQCEEYTCSVCGGACWYYDYSHTLGKSRYCPNCGARMDEVKP